MKQININYDDPPFAIKEGDSVKNITFKAVGSNYGRVIFQNIFVLTETEKDIENFTIGNCNFIGNGECDAIRIHLNEVKVR